MLGSRIVDARSVGASRFHPGRRCHAGRHARNAVAAMRKRYVAVGGLGGRERRAAAAQLTIWGRRDVVCDYENHGCL
jgi:hypothetical protein